MNKFVNKFNEYEQRTGNYLPLNVLAKVTWLGGGVLSAVEVASNGPTKEGLAAAAVTVGAVALDKLTGGLSSRYPKKQVEQSEIN